MQRFIFSLAFAILSLTALKASAWCDSFCDLDWNFYDLHFDRWWCNLNWKVRSKVEFSAGYRHDDLKWSIAGPFGSPNILSELRWRNLEILEAKGQGRWLICDHLVICGSAACGHIYHGRNRDSDYAGNDKTFEFSRSRAKSNQGEVYDFSGALGWQFNLCQGPWKLAPLAGYSSSAQHLRDHQGFQVINVEFNAFGEEVPVGPLGPFPGLHSNYRAKWRGPWVGFDTSYQLCRDWDVFGTFEYHWLRYTGTGHWNLRPDFVKDFIQKTHRGYGYVATAGSRHSFWCNWSIGVTGSYTWMKSGAGKDIIFLVTGPEKTRFNGARWNSWSVLADIGYSY